MSKKSRDASHAGSWYSDDEGTLDQQLTKWLKNAAVTDMGARGIISPHAGYSYSGPPAAHGFINIDSSKIKRIFILGPSHHHYLSKCALSAMDVYETPLGNMKIDKKVIEQLHSTGLFDWMSKEVDEAEHSIEMQLPYIRKMMGDSDFTLVPILVGSTTPQSEAQFGQLLAPFMADKNNFFVISSDFCHWGKRFSYYHLEDDDGPIYQSIERMDREGMKMVESGDPDSFYSYLKRTKNTICGRHPIGIFMQMMKAAEANYSTKFVHYAQSNQCVSQKDSSVSYAVGVSSQK